jgi:hypothetical protein
MTRWPPVEFSVISAICVSAFTSSVAQLPALFITAFHFEIHSGKCAPGSSAERNSISTGLGTVQHMLRRRRHRPVKCGEIPACVADRRDLVHLADPPTFGTVART